MSGGQKASDYVLEPCVAMPEITAAPDQRDWGLAVDGIGVLSEKGMWEARAKAAEDAAEKLEDCLQAARQILWGNYLGEGCEEGNTLRGLVQAQVVSDHGWSGQLQVQIGQLRELAKQCASAAAALEATDQSSATQIGQGNASS
ncbi:hypothetical protein [Gordonia sp. (in: high G+C Gram-positive bacteria)]|uniref:hypothetical protein n=1 Tax=Gordonia sp. (in: high G+C Gram-positive bacteria) TaxID=84139 RepID=UPI00257B4A2B|nr:hypothetical protein [Gordonia sp. (in: high G+C Gram-positive bacteria)]